MDKRQEHQDQDDETEPADATKASFADQDLQFLTDHKVYDKQFAGFVGIETFCCNCEQSFLLENKLHKHLKEECSQKTKAVSKKTYLVTRSATRATALVPPRALTPDNMLTMPQDSRDAIFIVKSTVPKSDLGLEYAFCNWNYAMVLAALKPNFWSHDETLSKQHIKTPPINANWIEAQEAASSDRNGCMDTECGVTLIDRDWLKAQLPKAKILKMATSLNIKGIETLKHETDEYVLKTLYFLAISNKGQPVVVCIRFELHLVDNLRANILIGNDIISAKGITINIAKEKAYISECKATVPITPRQHG